MEVFKGKSFKEARNKSEKLAKEVGLIDKFKVASRGLSGGMQRRCSIGMAITGDPSIIFLDEPSSGLDPVKRRELWRLIKEIVKTRSLLLTTHLMEEADTLCDRLAIITEGQLRCHGTSISLKKEYSKGFNL